ncbi:MAG: hypothetical protein Tsb0032_30240 [Kiloniellaceae bacterium]
MAAKGLLHQDLAAARDDQGLQRLQGARLAEDGGKINGPRLGDGSVGKNRQQEDKPEQERDG